MKDYLCSTGAVVAGDRFAAEAGIDIVRRGGNAVDAIVASLLVECVVQPHNVGLGGYAGTMAIYSAADQRVVAIDFDGAAPLAATPDMFPPDLCTDNWDSNNGGPPSPGINEHGALCITVPPIVAGLALALERYGTMSFSDVAAPAEKLARDGFPVHSGLAKGFAFYAAHGDPASQKLVLPRGVPGIGDILVQTPLADLFSRLRRDGPESFYAGDIPRAIASAIKARGGIIDEADFSAVDPRVEEPIWADCGDCRVHVAAPPAGGLTSLQMLKVIDRARLHETDFAGPSYYRILIEAARHAWADRYRLLGDPSFVDVPVASLLSQDRAEEILRSVEAGAPAPSLGAEPAGAAHTVHLVTADRKRNMASVTATHGSWFGSTLAIDGLGLVLGHGMSRFDPVPGRPNSIAPGKRMQHNMSPAIITKDGRPLCAIGLPGGRKIVNAIALLAHAIARHGLTAGQAMDLARFHVEGDGPALVDSDELLDLLRREFGPNYPVERALKKLGGPVAGVMVAQRTDFLMAASEAGRECVATL